MVGTYTPVVATWSTFPSSVTCQTYVSNSSFVLSASVLNGDSNLVRWRFTTDRLSDTIFFFPRLRTGTCRGSTEWRKIQTLGIIH